MFESFYLLLCIIFHVGVAALVSSVVLCSKKKTPGEHANANSTADGKNDLKFDIANDGAPPETELKSDADANLLGDKKIQCKIMPGCQASQNKKGANGYQGDHSCHVLAPGEKPLAVKSVSCAPAGKVVNNKK